MSRQIRFFVETESHKVNTVSVEELERQFGFTYIETTEFAEGFKLPIGNLSNSSEIIPRAKLPKRFNMVNDPLSYLILYYDKHTGWGVKARKSIPKNTALVAYGGIINDLKSFSATDNYVMTVSLPIQSPLDCIREPLKYIAGISGRTKSNIARFFQHLIKPPKLPTKLDDSYVDIATENIAPQSIFDEKKQIPMIFMVTKQDIAEGEPLGFDYGDAHFELSKIKPYYFTLSGRAFSPNIVESLKHYNRKWRKLLQKEWTNLKDSKQPNWNKGGCLLTLFSFLRYQDLCDLVCVNKTFLLLAQTGPLPYLIRSTSI